MPHRPPSDLSHPRPAGVVWRVRPSIGADWLPRVPSSASVPLSSSPPHILVTALGRSARAAKYALGAFRAEALLSPLGLLELLGRRGDPVPEQVVALVTEGAGASAQVLREGLIPLGLELEEVRVPDGKDSLEIRELVEAVGRAVPDGARLSLDITHGFRHFPFLFSVAANYLTSLRGVSICGVWYGMLEAGEPAPFVDLTILTELPRWQAAVAELRKSARSARLAEEFTHEAIQHKQRVRHDGVGRAPGAKPLAAIAGHLGRGAVAYECALPLELGKSMGEALGLSPRVEEVLELPFAAELLEVAGRELEAMALDEAGERSSVGALTQAELDRQVHIINRYIQSRMFAQASRLIREWVISKLQLERGRTKPNEWLDHSYSEGKPSPGSRGEVELALGQLAAAPGGLLTEEQRRLARFWNQVTGLRNPLAHCGMTKSAGGIGGRGGWIDVERPFMAVASSWKNWLAVPFPDLAFGGGGGSLLVTPVGMSPGVLTTCLSHIHADQLLLVVTAESKALSLEALAGLAESAPPQEQTRLIEVPADPKGAAELLRAGVVEEDLLQLLGRVDDVVLCLTGGTTMMGLIAGSIGEIARRLGRPVRRLVAFDERPSEEQRKDPYRVGHIAWLDSEELNR